MLLSSGPGHFDDIQFAKMPMKAKGISLSHTVINTIKTRFRKTTGWVYFGHFVHISQIHKNIQ